MKISTYLFLTTFVLSMLPPRKKIKVWLCGDSTMSIKESKAYPETGWGMPFVYFFDSSVVVDNRAKNGRSTKTFITEKLWQDVIDNVQEGDYVFVQFGHNDEVSTKKSYATPEEYSANLTRFIEETKKKDAIPVLLTSVSRRQFDSAGKALETHLEYSKLVREVAAKEKCIFIDMDRKSQDLLQQFGKENSKLLFLQLKPGEHPNYPEGREDNTHFNEFGARLMAQLVLAEIKAQHLDLAQRIVVPPKK